MVIFVLLDRKLYVNYRSVDGVWQSALSGLEMDKWYTLDLSWDDENGMTVYVNDVQRAWQQVDYWSCHTSTIHILT